MESDLMNRQQFCHPAHDDEQQQMLQQQQKYSNTKSSSSGSRTLYKYMLLWKC